MKEQIKKEDEKVQRTKKLIEKLSKKLDEESLGLQKKILTPYLKTVLAISWIKLLDDVEVDYVEYVSISSTVAFVAVVDGVRIRGCRPLSELVSDYVLYEMALEQ